VLLAEQYESKSDLVVKINSRWIVRFQGQELSGRVHWFNIQDDEHIHARESL